MKIDEESRGVRALSAGRTVDVRLGEGWQRVEPERAEPVAPPEWHPHHHRHVRPTTDIRLRGGGARVVDLDSGVERRVPWGESLAIDADETVAVHAPVPTLIAPAAPSTVFVDEDTGSVSVSVPDGKTATIAWATPPDPPVDEIRVDRSAAGVAAGVTAASVALPQTLSPRRTWPNSRTPAPRIVFGGVDGAAPSEVEVQRSEVELSLPDGDELAYVVAVSTLVYYLGATVTFGGETARLHAGGSSWSLGSTPAEADRTASAWLRQVFYLDSLVRCAGPDGVRLREADAALAYVDDDAETLFGLDMGARVARYLEADDAVLDELPEWSAAVHVAPNLGRMSRLSQYLGRLDDVRLPRGQELSVGELSEWSPAPAAAVRGASEESAVPRPRIVPEAHGEVGVVGWDAPGQPGRGYRVVDDHTPAIRGDGPLSVTVVRCGWQSAHQTVDRWRGREDHLKMDVDVVGDPTVADLLEVLRRGQDVVQIAAHDGGSGVECADGRLQPGHVDEVAAGVVIANCCDSERWATEAVRAGATAGVGTTGPIPQSVASRDGADLAGLLSLGWSVERAVNLVRAAAERSSWVVVGDGGARVGQADAPTPPAVVVNEDGRTQISNLSPDGVGYRITSPGIAEPHLPGRRTTDDPATSLPDLQSPVVEGGEIRWPDER